MIQDLKSQAVKSVSSLLSEAPNHPVGPVNISYCASSILFSSVNV